MKSSVLLTIVLGLAIACAACNQQDTSSKQKAAEASKDQPLVPSPNTEPAPPETPAQTQQDVAQAKEQAKDTREQVAMASTVAKAEADYEVDVQKCEALDGQQRTDCLYAAAQKLEDIKAHEAAELERRQHEGHL